MRDYCKMSPDELQWRGRDDARTLAEAEAIKADKARIANAQKEAQNMLKEESDRIKGLSKVAGNKNVSVSTSPKHQGVVRPSFVPHGGFPTQPKF